MDVKAVLWTMLSVTSKPTEELIPKRAIHIRLEMENASSNKLMSAQPALVFQLNYFLYFYVLHVFECSVLSEIQVRHVTNNINMNYIVKIKKSVSSRKSEQQASDIEISNV